jgi:hypothetical protein
MPALQADASASFAAAVPLSLQGAIHTAPDELPGNVPGPSSPARGRRLRHWPRSLRRRRAAAAAVTPRQLLLFRSSTHRAAERAGRQS